MGSQGHGVTELLRSECGAGKVMTPRKVKVAGKVMNPRKVKVEAVCSRWLNSQCSYGDCMFRHDTQDPKLPDSEEYLANRYAQGSSMSSSSEAAGAYDAVMGDSESSNSRDSNGSKQKCGSKALQQTA